MTFLPFANRFSTVIQDTFAAPTLHAPVSVFLSVTMLPLVLLEHVGTTALISHALTVLNVLMDTLLITLTFLKRIRLVVAISADARFVRPV